MWATDGVRRDLGASKQYVVVVLVVSVWKATSLMRVIFIFGGGGVFVGDLRCVVR